MTLSGTMHTETSVSEPLMKYRKLIRRCQNQGSHSFPGIKAWRLPISGQAASGIEAASPCIRLLYGT